MGLTREICALKTSSYSIKWLEMILKVGGKVQWEANAFPGVRAVFRLCILAGPGGEIPFVVSSRFCAAGHVGPVVMCRGKARRILNRDCQGNSCFSAVALGTQVTLELSMAGVNSG